MSPLSSSIPLNPTHPMTRVLGTAPHRSMATININISPRMPLLLPSTEGALVPTPPSRATARRTLLPDSTDTERRRPKATTRATTNGEARRTRPSSMTDMALSISRDMPVLPRDSTPRDSTASPELDLTVIAA